VAKEPAGITEGEVTSLRRQDNGEERASSQANHRREL